MRNTKQRIFGTYTLAELHAAPYNSSVSLTGIANPGKGESIPNEARGLGYRIIGNTDKLSIIRRRTIQPQLRDAAAGRSAVIFNE